MALRGLRCAGCVTMRAGPTILENLPMRCMLRSCMEATHKAQQVISSPCSGSRRHYAWLCSARRQPRNASGGRSRSSRAGPCGSVKSPGSGRDASSRIAGCGSSGASVSGTALAQGHGACGARGAGTDSRMGRRWPSLVADDTWLACASRALVRASARTLATDVDAATAVNT